MSQKIRVLFVCVENSNRSQMAQAFAAMYGGDRVEALSAGSRPSGKVNPKAVAAMAELGYDLSTHASKNVSDYNGTEIDAAVTMGCGDPQQAEAAGVPGPRRLGFLALPSAARRLISRRAACRSRNGQTRNLPSDAPTRSVRRRRAETTKRSRPSDGLSPPHRPHSRAQACAVVTITTIL